MAGLTARAGSSPLRAHLARLTSRSAGESALALANGTNYSAEHFRGGPARPPRFPCLDKLAHFPSHILKSGAKYAAGELNGLLRAQFGLLGNRTQRQFDFQNVAGKEARRRLMNESLRSRSKNYIPDR